MIIVSEMLVIVFWSAKAWIMLTWKVVQFFKLKCDDAHDHYHAKLNDKRSYLSELLTALCMPDIIPLNLVWFYRFVHI